MPKIPMYDPGTSEARSPWLAGLTEACNKISSILNLKTGTLKDFQLSEVFISSNDRCRIYQASLGNKLWLETPAPVFRKNGIVITPIADNFEIDYLGGSIAFDSNSRLTTNDVVRVDATYIIDESGTLNDIISRIDSISDSASKFKGYFGSYDSLVSSIVTGVSGDYAIVGGEENTIYIWNATTNRWEGIAPEIDLSNYYTIEQTDGLLSKKENNIPAHGTTAESDEYYLGGRKTWQKIDDKVLNSPIGDIDTTTSAPIGPEDTVSTGLGKLQAQVNNYTHDLFGTGAPEATTVGKIGQDYTNTSNGDKYHLTSIENGVYNWEKYSNCVIPSNANNIALLGPDGQLVDSKKAIDKVGRTPFTLVANVSLANTAWTKPNNGFGSWQHKITLLDERIKDWENRTVIVCPAADMSFGLSANDNITNLIYKYKVKADALIQSPYPEFLDLTFSATFHEETFDYGAIRYYIIVEPTDT